MMDTLNSMVAKDVDAKFEAEVKRCVSKAEKPVTDKELSTFARHFLFAGFWYGKTEAEKIAMQHKHFSKRDIFFYLAIVLNLLSVTFCVLYFFHIKNLTNQIQDSIKGSAIQRYHIANEENDENRFLYVSSFEFFTEEEAKRFQQFVLQIKMVD